MAQHDEEIDRLRVVDRCFEPRLGNGVVGRDHAGDIRITSEVV